MKCCVCEKEIELTRDNVDNFADYHNKKYHLNCLLEKCKTNTAVWKKNNADIIENMETYSNEWKNTFLEMVIKEELSQKKKSRKRSFQKRDFLERTCKVCGKHFWLDRGNAHQHITYNKGSYHEECFIEMINKNKRKYMWETSHLDVIKEESYKQNIFLVNSDTLYNYLFDAYEIPMLSTYAYMTFTSVFSGTYKNLRRPLDPYEVYEIWKRLHDDTDYLKKASAKKEFNKTESEILYHLAIVVSQYDSYKKWKERQIRLENEQKDSMAMLQTMQRNELLVEQANNRREEERRQEIEQRGYDDIDELLKEIYGEDD